MAYNVFVQASGASSTLTVDFLPTGVGTWNLLVQAQGASSSLLVDSWSAPPVGGVTCKVYNGTAWVEAIPKVYDGSAWVTATPKVRDSSGWV